MVLSNIDLAKKFNRSKWDGPIEVLTRKTLASQLGVSQRTLRRWEQKGVIESPFNCVQGAGRGNHAIYKNPYEGIITILTTGDDTYIRYINGKIRWRKRRSDIGEIKQYGGKGNTQDELV